MSEFLELHSDVQLDHPLLYDSRHCVSFRTALQLLSISLSLSFHVYLCLCLSLSLCFGMMDSTFFKLPGMVNLDV